MEHGKSRKRVAGSGFDMEEWPFFWLTRVVGRYLQHLDTVLKRIGLDVPRWRVLMCLAGERPVSVSELADLAIVKMSTMTKIVQRMQADGLVVCAVSSEDGRVTVVAATPAGVAARQEAWKAASALYERAFARVPKSKVTGLNEVLATVFGQLGP